MNNQVIPHIHFGKHPVYSKLIVIFTKRPCHIVHMVARLIFLAQHGDVVVSAVHGRAHQVGCAGI